MEMRFHLAKDIFEVVKNGTKCVEIRLNDEKRKKLRVGDKLVFLDMDEKSNIETIIEELSYYKDAKEMIKYYSIEEIYLKGYTKEYFLDLLKRFYSEEEQRKYK